MKNKSSSKSKNVEARLRAGVWKSNNHLIEHERTSEEREKKTALL